ncbi:MAG: dihydrofolate reductase [Phycisphaerales bacterium]
MNTSHIAHRTLDIALVAAVSDNGVIGRGNDLPWRLPDDMKFFMELTRGNTVIMGRRTFESMKSKPLPGRRNIVVTRRTDWQSGGVEAAGSLEQAIELGHLNQLGRLFVIGGAELYRQALAHKDLTRIYLTRVHAQVDGDTYFPIVDWSAWRLLERRDHPMDSRHPFTFSFEVYGKNL